MFTVVGRAGSRVRGHHPAAGDARRPCPAGATHQDSRLRADAPLGSLPRPVDWSGRRRPAARQRRRCRGFLRQVRLGTGHAADRARRPGRLPELAARFSAPDVPRPVTWARPAPGAGVHDRRGRPARDTSETAERKKADWRDRRPRKATGTRTSQGTALGSRIGLPGRSLFRPPHRAVPAAREGAPAGGAACDRRRWTSVRASRRDNSRLLKPDVIPAVLRITGAAVVNA
ncbi:hypothetical protein HBB16_01355 [Pseudonocardia sp. MCCB 268]|nr:hypothetical protein [Pseudonocardia cytotoxica]